MSPLDDASMLAAYRASFVGTFHREPTLQPGSGADDGGYWVRTSNHYGLYGDDVCRAGWNLYRERQLAGEPTGPLDGDQSARFQPTIQPPVPPVQPPPLPVPPPAPIFSEAALLAAIQHAHDLEMDAIAAVGQKVDDFRDAVRSKWAALAKNPIFQVVVTAVSTWAATYVMRKP